jgi:putative DNA primase/helicase
MTDTAEATATTVDMPPDELRLNDLGNARLLVQLHGKDLRWCGAMPGTGWMVWDKSRWRPDDTKLVTRLASQLGAEWRDRAPPEIDDPIGLDERVAMLQKRRKAMLKHADRTESAGGIRAAVELATAHPDIAVPKDIWDKDLWKFNTPDRTYDLDRMRSSRPNQADYITRCARVGADRSDCPTWKRFLMAIMGGNEELVAFLQRAVGYSLSGSIQEQKMFICYGKGANGKSTFMDAISYIMGDYATTTPVDTFINRREGSIPNDLAALAGVRLVTCSEGTEGGVLEEGLIKLVTGGDPIAARFLGKEFFHFIPAFKLWFLTNHKPIIRGSDEGVWRRPLLIPFTVTIPKEQRNRDLPKILREEACGIMQWALEGLKEWRRIGLAPPLVVTQATDAYREEMDVLADFLADCCEVDENGLQVSRASNKEVYARYCAWAKEQGLRQQSHRWLSRSLVDRGYVQDKSRNDGQRWWLGFSLRRIL